MNLQSVTLSESLTSIPDNAFYNCKKLSAVNLPAGVKSIGCGAFQFCSVLGNLALPESLRTIGASAFHNCAADFRVTLPNSVISVCGGSFNGVTEKYLDGEKRFLDRVAFADATQFNVYRWNSTEKAYVCRGNAFASDADPTQFTETGLNPGAPCYYKVVAVCKGGGLTFVSAYSAAAHATAVYYRR